MGSQKDPDASLLFLYEPALGGTNQCLGRTTLIYSESCVLNNFIVFHQTPLFKGSFVMTIFRTKLPAHVLLGNKSLANHCNNAKNLSVTGDCWLHVRSQEYQAHSDDRITLRESGWRNRVRTRSNGRRSI